MLKELIDTWEAEECKKSIHIGGRYLSMILKKLRAERISTPIDFKNVSGVLVAITTPFIMGGAENLYEITDEGQLDKQNRLGMLIGRDYYVLTEKQVSIFKELLDARIAASRLETKILKKSKPIRTAPSPV